MAPTLEPLTTVAWEVAGKRFEAQAPRCQATVGRRQDRQCGHPGLLGGPYRTSHRPRPQGGPMSDDAILMLKVTSLTTTSADLEEKTGVFVQLSGRVVSPVETILALVRAQKRGQPIVALALVDDRTGARDGA